MSKAGQPMSEVMYDSPTEFLQDVVQGSDRCVAQSVIPLDDGTYACACSCNAWEFIALGRQEGLQACRRHTRSV
jgi:hypothetical protein